MTKIKNTTLKKKVFVAMSGGVDSSVAAALLKKQGYDVVGVFFKPWQPDNGPAFCNWQQDREDALRVATKLGIPFETWDLSKEYGTEVTTYMIEGYRRGITPNPDIMCNKKIKFGIFLERALAAGADYIATGHYAIKTCNNSRDIYSLRAAKDTNKDQTYFLYTLNQHQLKHALFPIGSYTKPQVRQIAKRQGLITHNKKDSQGVCFVGQLDMKTFLSNHIAPQQGMVKLLENDQIIGHHDGTAYYTIGQRRGLNLGISGGPYFIAKKDIPTNTIYVTTQHRSLDSITSAITQVHWIENTQPTASVSAQIKIRYRAKAIPAVITPQQHSTEATIHFKQRVRALTPGQSAVFYKGTRVLGGGVII